MNIKARPSGSNF